MCSCCCLYCCLVHSAGREIWTSLLARTFWATFLLNWSQFVPLFAKKWLFGLGKLFQGVIETRLTAWLFYCYYFSNATAALGQGGNALISLSRLLLWGRGKMSSKVAFPSQADATAAPCYSAGLRSSVGGGVFDVWMLLLLRYYCCYCWLCRRESAAFCYVFCWKCEVLAATPLATVVMNGCLLL